MSKTAFPKNEYVWGIIQTTNGFDFEITHNAINGKYYLYRKVNSHYNKITNSTVANNLLKKISEYEKQTKDICGYFNCIYATSDGCSIEGWNDAEGELNGTKSFCPIYNKQCIHARCHYCSREKTEICSRKTKMKGSSILC